jgi:5'-3' exonuclease
MLFVRKRICLIDFSWMAYRCLLQPEAARISEHCNDAYAGPTFLLYRGIRAILNQFDHPIFVIDGWPDHKKKLFPGYKAQREAARNEDPAAAELGRSLKRQLRTWVIQTLPSIIAYLPHEEADDTIASLATQLSNSGIGVDILASDKDLWQLMDLPNLKIWGADGGRYAEISMERLQNEFGCAPAKIPLFKAWLGDASDNIPKIPRISSAGVVQMINACSSIDECVARASEFFKVTANYNWPKLVADFKAKAEVSLKIATLNRNLEVPFAYYRPDAGILQSIFQNYRIQSLNAAEMYNEMANSQNSALRILLDSKVLDQSRRAQVDKLL